MPFPQKPTFSLSDTPNETIVKIGAYITNIHNWLKETHNIKDDNWKDSKGAWMESFQKAINGEPQHTSSPERMMLTNITWLIRDAEKCLTFGKPCPLMGVLLAIKKSLQIEVKNMGNNDRDQRP